MNKYIDIVFDSPPGPEAPRFVEVESSGGFSVGFGSWLERSDGYHVLRIQEKDFLSIQEPKRKPKWRVYKGRIVHWIRTKFTRKEYY